MQEILEKTNKVKKINKYNYLVIINNIEYKLHIETIIKYNLLSDDIKYTHDEIINLDNMMRKYLDIDKYFIRYPKSKQEAIYILINKYQIINYEDIINRLIKFNIINDELLKSNIIESLENRLYGPLYINNMLYKRGLVNDYVITYDNKELYNRFDKLLKNKVSKDKAYRYLLTKGYHISDINQYFSTYK